jgi:hypothetical protein
MDNALDTYNHVNNENHYNHVEEDMASPEDEDEEGYVVPRRGEDGEWIV